MNTESKYSIEDIVNKTILKTLHSINFEIHPKEWMTLAKIKVQVSEGTYRKTRAETYQEVYDLWVVQYEKSVEESTFVKTVGYFKNHILPSMGNYRIEKINIAVCQKHYNEWAAKVKKARTIKSYAKKVLDFAIVHGYIENNPFDHVETKVKQTYVDPIDENEENFYSREELVTFLKHAEIHLDYKAYAFFD